MRLANWGLALWVLAETALSFRFISTTAELVEQIAIGLVSLRVVVCVLRRPAPATTHAGGAVWVLVLLSVAFPFAFAMACPPGPENMLALALRWVGIALFAWSVSSLGTSFSVMPQGRALISRGPYRIVRHPMYAAYIIMDAAWWTNHPAWLPFALWASELFILLRRAALEDRCVRSLPGYRCYAQQVPYRLFPGVL